MVLIMLGYRTGDLVSMQTPCELVTLVAFRGAGPAFGAFSRFVQFVGPRYPPGGGGGGGGVVLGKCVGGVGGGGGGGVG
jgi:hypothetical protein